MPQIEAGLLDRLIHAFNPIEGRVICVPTWRGKRGNPVLWGRKLFAEMAALTGDVGAKHLMTEHPELVAEVPAESEAVLTDIDTPEALAALAGSEWSPPSLPPPRRGGREF
jgi:molybdenum cofactor cytidylyltransferase